MDTWKADSSFSNLAKISDFAERIGYDANGNILKYQRNGNNTFAGKPLGMDSLTYSYKTGTNQLDHIVDSVDANNYTEDIDKQAAGNYNYDAIGNLVKDDAGGISNINWTVYGKIDSITKTNGSTIKYLYDAAGNRISKTVKQAAITSTTGYVRDASGNVMSVYTAADTTNSGHLMQSEVDLYGSSRLGIWKPGIDVDYLTPATDTMVPLLGTGYSLTFTRGNKLFELSNHLGNVLTTLSDKKLQHTSDSATVDYYQPDVVSAGDYYPFGMGMPGRSYSSGSNYRYGFNGKEKDADMDGNNYDYGFRIYNPQIGRFLSTDPLMKGYPQLTPYQFASNSPLANIDMDGQEAKYYNIVIAETYDGKGKLSQVTRTTTYDKAKEAGLHMHGIMPWYTSSGKLGNGTLYNVTKVKNYASDRSGVQHSIISNVGSVYTPPPPNATKEHPTSSFSFGIQIFGSGYDPDEAPTSKANSNMHVVTFNFKEFQDIMEPVLLGLDVNSPTELAPPSLDKLIEHAGEGEIDKALDKLNKKWEGKEEKANATTHCRACNKNFIKVDGVTTWDETKDPAKDTIDYHGQDGDKKKEKSIPKQN